MEHNTAGRNSEECLSFVVPGTKDCPKLLIPNIHKVLIADNYLDGGRSHTDTLQCYQDCQKIFTPSREFCWIRT
jgi:hypothetical protein